KPVKLSFTYPLLVQFIPINMPNDPQGLQCMLQYLTDTYQNIPIYVQENGYGQFFIDSVNDHNRVEYLSGYIGSTLAALREWSQREGLLCLVIPGRVRVYGGLLFAIRTALR
uniref:Uncharacterized protein n=1 Tax=Aegilops tauschii subsp. strangulata TaxID=200361 RepID=A0A452YYG3_AEGTS